LIFSLAVLALILILALTAFYFIRSERVNRYLVQELERALLDYGLRAEIGEFKLQWRERTVRLGRVRVFNRETGQLITTVNDLKIAADVPNPYALKLRREVILKEVTLNGVDLYVEVDQQGRTNLRGIKSPEREPGRITVDYSSLLGTLNGGTVHLNDQSHNLQAVWRDLRAEARPVSGASSVSLRLNAGEGLISYEGRETPLQSLEVVGQAGPSEAVVESFSLRSPLAGLTASGKIENWKTPHYDVKLQASVALSEATKVLALKPPVSGTATFNGQIAGGVAEDRAGYQISGELATDELAMAGMRLRGVRIENVSLRPNGAEISFSSSRVSAQTAAVDGTTIHNAAIERVQGEWRNNRVELAAPQATVARLNLAQGQLSEIALQRPEVTVHDGKYEARSGLTIAGGTLQGAAVRQASGQLTASDGIVALRDFKAQLLGGSASANLALQTGGRGVSHLEAKLTGINTGDLVSIINNNGKDGRNGRNQRIPLAGSVSGEARLDWPGMNFRRPTGTVSAQFTGNITAASDAIPVNGRVALNAQGGQFVIDEARLATDVSTLNASGRFALEGDSDLRVALVSTDAAQLQTILGSVDAAREMIVEYEPQLAGDFKFESRLTGPLANPTVEGQLSVASLSMHTEPLGSLSAQLFLTPVQVRVENALLTTPSSGST
jgi:hypothetical protein